MTGCVCSEGGGVRKRYNECLPLFPQFFLVCLCVLPPCPCMLLLLSPVGLHLAAGSAHESLLIGGLYCREVQWLKPLGWRALNQPLVKSRPLQAEREAERGRPRSLPRRAALKVRSADTHCAPTSEPGAHRHCRQLSSPMQVNSIMHMWWGLKYHRARRMVRPRTRPRCFLLQHPQYLRPSSFSLHCHAERLLIEGTVGFFFFFNTHNK